VEIDEAWCDDEAARIDFPRRLGAGRDVANSDYAVAADSDSPEEPGIARPVDNAAAANEKVVRRLLSAEPAERSGQRNTRQDNGDCESAHDCVRV
jgi:hypothetical protein